MRSFPTIILILLIMSLPTAQSLLITPLDDINLTVDAGFTNIIFTITNDENTSANISINITSSLDGIIFFSDNELTVLANSSSNVTCIISRSIPATGKLYFEYNSSITEINVTIIEEEDNETKGNLTIIPSQPTSKSNIIFLLPICEDATGYMICYETNKVYIIEVKGGIGFVELGDDYGESYVVILGKETYSAKFTIDPYFHEDLTINMPSKTTIDTVTSFQVFASGESIQAELYFELEGYNIFSRMTDTDGKLNITLNKGGNWSVTAKVFNVEKTQQIQVSKKPMEIIIPEEIYVDQEIDISVGEKADIIISMDEMSWQYTTDDSGDLPFTPSYPGKHNIHAVSQENEGTRDFIVYASTIITIKGENDEEMTVIYPDTTYAIYVTDGNNKPIESKLEIYGNDGLLDEIDIAGSTIWKSREFYNNYEFKVTPTESGYPESNLFLYGQEAELLNMGALFPWIVLVVICALLILIWIFKRDWFLSLHEHYRNWRQRRRKPIIPV